MEVFGTTLGGLSLVIVLLLVVALVFGGVLVTLRSIARQKEAGARARYPNALEIERAASFFGQESRGVMQLRGNGTLILTDSDVIFEMWVPNKALRIPLRSIEALENPTSFLGKSRFTPLLKIVYTNEQGATDSMAWQVRDLGAWMHRISAARPPTRSGSGDGAF